MHFIISQKLMPRMLLTGSGLCLALSANVKVHTRSLLYGSGQTRGKQCEESWLTLRDCLSRVSPGFCLGCSGGSQRTMQVQFPSLGTVDRASLFLGRTWLYSVPCVPSLLSLPGFSPHGKVMVWPIGRVVSHGQNEDTAAYAPMRGCRD